MSIKLLLADNSVSVQKVVELALADRDVNLATVTDGSAAFERAKEMVPDVLLADVELPELDGYSLCRRVKEEPATRETKVVLLKRAFTDYDQGRADAVGADGMLEKPFKAASLLQAMGIEGGSEEESEAARTSEAEEIGPAPRDDSVFDLMEDALAIDSSEVPAEKSPFDLKAKATVEESAIEAAAEDETFVGEAAAPAEVDVSDEVSFSDIGVLDEEEAVVPSEPVEVSEIPVAPEEVAFTETEEDRVLESRLEEMPAPPPPAAEDAAAAREGQELIEEIVKQLSDDVIREVAWEVVPDLAERLIREAIEKITTPEPGESDD